MKWGDQTKKNGILVYLALFGACHNFIKSSKSKSKSIFFGISESLITRGKSLQFFFVVFTQCFFKGGECVLQLYNILSYTHHRIIICIIQHQSSFVNFCSSFLAPATVFLLVFKVFVVFLYARAFVTIH